MTCTLERAGRRRGVRAASPATETAIGRPGGEPRLCSRLALIELGLSFDFKWGERAVLRQKLSQRSDTICNHNSIVTNYAVSVHKTKLTNWTLSYWADVREWIGMEYGYLSGAGGGFDGGCLGGGGELSWGELASCGQMSQAAYRYQGMRYQPPPPQCARPQDTTMRNHHIFPPAMNLQRK